MNKTLIYVSLGLALALVVGVLVGSKVVMQKLNNQPVSLSELPSPMADSPECAQLIDSLPDELAGHRRTELLDPAPAGAAVWQSASDQRVTLRCGVEAPLQYTELTPTFEAAGARWIEISDPTAGADLSTWFTVDRSPVVAVTADHQTVREGESPVDKLDLSALPEEASEPAPAPLAGLEPAEGAGAECETLLGALPDELVPGYARLDLSNVASLDDASAAAWGGNSVEPIVIRCGVAAPASYEPGAQLTQINDTPWFQEENSDGTATLLYALGRRTDIAVSLPMGVGEEALTKLTNLIEENVPAQ